MFPCNQKHISKGDWYEAHCQSELEGCSGYLNTDPGDCVVDKTCEIAVSYYAINADQYRFSIYGQDYFDTMENNYYLAAGVNQNKAMLGASVMACFMFDNGTGGEIEP